MLIKATSPGPVFFRQARTGRYEKTFFVLKFRTMYRRRRGAPDEIDHLNEMDGPLFKVTNDPRVTRVGRFLRRTSLDEIPQLINVWKGDMSLVGPRPFVVAEAAEIEGWARKRFEARPGMTGLWQVSGRNELSHLELCRLDYLYVASWSFWWDLQILWQTPAPSSKDGAPPEPSAPGFRAGRRSSSITWFIRSMNTGREKRSACACRASTLPRPKRRAGRGPPRSPRPDGRSKNTPVSAFDDGVEEAAPSQGRGRLAERRRPRPG